MAKNKKANKSSKKTKEAPKAAPAKVEAPKIEKPAPHNPAPETVVAPPPQVQNQPVVPETPDEPKQLNNKMATLRDDTDEKGDPIDPRVKPIRNAPVAIFVCEDGHRSMGYKGIPRECAHCFKKTEMEGYYENDTFVKVKK